MVTSIIAVREWIMIAGLNREIVAGDISMYYHILKDASKELVMEMILSVEGRVVFR